MKHWGQADAEKLLEQMDHRTRTGEEYRERTQLAQANALVAIAHHLERIADSVEGGTLAVAVDK
jgi:ATP/maltotriose-dependent transcriptional regulator MalT